MKKTINGIIIALACVVLVLGVVAACMTSVIINSKTTESYYAKDGRIKTSREISVDESYLYVKDSSVEVITESEYLHRRANNYKIRMDKAKMEYQADKTEENLVIYNSAKAQYESASTAACNFDMSLITTGAKEFFGTYFPIAVLLMLALLINIKIEYKKRDKN